MLMDAAELKTQLNEALFWSYDFDKLNIDSSWFIIIEQVYLRGDWNEFKAILKYFTKEKLFKVATDSKVLDIKTVYFLSLLLQIPLKKMRSYNVNKLIDKGVHIF